MLRMAVGHAQCLDAACASHGAVEACRRGLGGVPPKALLLFTGVGYDHGAVLQTVEAAFPGVPLAGTTTAGEMSAGSGVTDDSVLLVAFGGEDVFATVGVVRDIADGSSEAVQASARVALETAMAGLASPPAVCLVFPDGSHGGVESVNLALSQVLGPNCPLVGGLAGRHPSDALPVRQFFGREILSGAAPFCLLAGNIPVAVRLTQSWRPVGGRARVTEASGRLVRRIDSRSALDFYRHYLGPHAEPASELPLAVTCDEGRDYYLRAPSFFSEGDGSILFGAGIPQGSVVQLAEANRFEVLEDVKASAREAAKMPAGAWTPAGALLFSCTTRKEILGTKAGEEAACLSEALPPGTPLAGFYCHGEICSSAPGKPVHLYNGSLVTLLLGGEVRPAERDAPPLELPCPASVEDSLRREVRSLERQLARATDYRQRLEAQKEHSQALMRTINEEISEAKLEIQRKNELLRQALALAEEVQRNLLPQAAPGLPGFDIAGTSLYSDETGGDYYDFIEAPNERKDRFGVIIGDVTGHGIAAALLMTTARAFLRMRSFQPGSLAAVMDDVNRLLCADLAETGRFMTLFYLAIDTEKKRLHWVRAGHDPIILYDVATGVVQDIPDKGGPPLGIVGEARYAENSTAGLTPGQVALLATDGLWEARNTAGQMFGKERVRELLRQHADKPAADIVDAVLAGLKAFLGEATAEDDVTLVAIKVLPH